MRPEESRALVHLALKALRAEFGRQQASPRGDNNFG